YPYSKKDVAPRLAVAYSPNTKTAIRAGFGMFYDLFGSGLMRSQDATAFGLSTALTNPSAVLSVATGELEPEQVRHRHVQERAGDRRRQRSEYVPQSAAGH